METETTTNFAEWQPIREIANQLQVTKQTVRNLLEQVPSELKAQGIKQQGNKLLINREIAEAITAIYEGNKGHTSAPAPTVKPIVIDSNPLEHPAVKAILEVKDAQIEQLQNTITYLQAQLDTKDNQLDKALDSVQAGQALLLPADATSTEAPIKKRFSLFNFKRGDKVQ